MALMRSMRKGLLNAYAMDMNNLVYVIDVPTYFKLLSMPEFATWQALGMNGANVTGLLPGGSTDQVGTAARPIGYIDNIPVFVSAELSLANSNGKVSGTGSNNTLGRAVLYHKQRWFLGIKRDVDFEAASLPLLSDVQLMQVTARCTVTSFDSQSAFVLFNIGV